MVEILPSHLNLTYLKSQIDSFQLAYLIHNKVVSLSKNRNTKGTTFQLYNQTLLPNSTKTLCLFPEYVNPEYTNLNHDTIPNVFFLTFRDLFFPPNAEHPGCTVPGTISLVVSTFRRMTFGIMDGRDWCIWENIA